MSPEAEEDEAKGGDGDEGEGDDDDDASTVEHDGRRRVFDGYFRTAS